MEENRLNETLENNAEGEVNEESLADCGENAGDACANEEVVEVSAEMISQEIKKAYKKGKRRGSIITAISLILGATLVFALVVIVRILIGSVPVGALSTFSSGAINKKVYKKAEGLFAMMENAYLDDIDKDAVREGMYKGMVNSLGDPYSTYYTKEEFDEMMESSSGSFEGIGCYMTQDADTREVVVSKPMKNSPAEKVGMLTGDVIVTVNGEDVRGEDINLVVSKIKGPAGTTVVVGVERRNEKDIIEFEIERALVYEESVEGKMLSEEDGIGYVYVSEFADDTANQFREIMEDLHDKGMTSLILDLRDNPGGYVDVCVDIADMILPECNIVSTKDKHGITSSYDSSDTEYIRMPIVVLVNENSASAAEILTGALKDNDYATVVGTTTFGKGIVQEVVPLDDGSGIKLTICKYYTPSGECIHKLGIEPDVKVELDYDKFLEKGIDNQLDAAKEILMK